MPSLTKFLGLAAAFSGTSEVESIRFLSRDRAGVSKAANKKQYDLREHRYRRRGQQAKSVTSLLFKKDPMMTYDPAMPGSYPLPPPMDYHPPPSMPMDYQPPMEPYHPPPMEMGYDPAAMPGAYPPPMEPYHPPMEPYHQPMDYHPPNSMEPYHPPMDYHPPNSMEPHYPADMPMEYHPAPQPADYDYHPPMDHYDYHPDRMDYHHPPTYHEEPYYDYEHPHPPQPHHYPHPPPHHEEEPRVPENLFKYLTKPDANTVTEDCMPVCIKMDGSEENCKEKICPHFATCIPEQYSDDGKLMVPDMDPLQVCLGSMPREEKEEEMEGPGRFQEHCMPKCVEVSHDESTPLGGFDEGYCPSICSHIEPCAMTVMTKPGQSGEDRDKGMMECGKESLNFVMAEARRGFNDVCHEECAHHAMKEGFPAVWCAHVPDTGSEGFSIAGLVGMQEDRLHKSICDEMDACRFEEKKSEKYCVDDIKYKVGEEMEILAKNSPSVAEKLHDDAVQNPANLGTTGFEEGRGDAYDALKNIDVSSEIAEAKATEDNGSPLDIALEGATSETEEPHHAPNPAEVPPPMDMDHHYPPMDMYHEHPPSAMPPHDDYHPPMDMHYPPSAMPPHDDYHPPMDMYHDHPEIYLSNKGKTDKIESSKAKSEKK